MSGNGSIHGRAGVALGAFVGLFASARPAEAQDFSLVTTLVHPNPRPIEEDRFGNALAISGGTLFVGAKSEQVANDYSGVVHVFTDAGWQEVAQLKSSVEADTGFGAAIQLDGEHALISNAAIDYGVAWFFEKVGGVWTEKLRLQGLVNEAFGYRLALRGDFAFVAAARVGAGKVHVYRRVAGTWSETQVLTADDGQEGDFFGYSIAFDGQRVAIGAPGNFLGPKRSGVYTFSKQGDTFVQDGKLAGDDPAAHWFGAEVGVSGDTLIVNAPPAYQVKFGGKALVYERSAEQWELDGELTVQDEESFPDGLALEGDTAWFDARTNDPRSLNVYAFDRTSGDWQRAQKLSFPELGENELGSWAFRDGTFAIGFWNGLRTESVQVYRRPGHESSSGGGSPTGSAGTEPAGGSSARGDTNAGGASGESSAAAGVGSNSSNSGSASSAEPGASSSSSESGGCTVVRSRNAWRAAPLAALAFALGLTRRRRTAAASTRRSNPA